MVKIDTASPVDEQWHPYPEEQPNCYGDYLVCLKNRACFVGTWHEGRWYIASADQCTATNEQVKYFKGIRLPL